MIAALLLTSILTAVSPAERTDQLTLHVTPRTCLSPGYVRAEAVVLPHPDNRQLVLLADSPAYYSSVTKELDGETDALVHDMLFKQLPAGVYIIRARLTRADGEQILREAIVDVR